MGINTVLNAVIQSPTKPKSNTHCRLKNRGHGITTKDGTKMTIFEVRGCPYGAVSDVVSDAVRVVPITTKANVSVLGARKAVVWNTGKHLQAAVEDLENCAKVKRVTVDKASNTVTLESDKSIETDKYGFAVGALPDVMISSAYE